VLLTYPQAAETTGRSKVTFGAPRQTNAPVKLGVLGAGLFANATLLPAIKKQAAVELVGIASVSGLHAQHSGRKFGFAYAASDDEQILGDPQINTVAILTRHDSHAGLVLKALKAGKNVFVEKPLAIQAAQLEEISAVLLQENCPLLTVGFNRRFAPLAAELADFLKDRGEPLHAHYRVNASLLPLNHWTQDPAVGGGRIIGEGCHFIDFISFLVGAAPVAVTTHGLPEGGKYREDNVSMTFTFPDGSIGVVDYLANGDKSFPKERVEVFCGGRIGVLDDFRFLELVQNGRRKMIKRAQDKGWAGEWATFAEAIRTGGEPTIPYGQLIGVTMATFAAVDSLRSGKRIEVG